MKAISTRDVSTGGFALVVTLSLMILLTILAVGLLGLSAVSLRASDRSAAMAMAQANARLAMIMALGELQQEMGPDMRVSAEAALFDQNQSTESIEGVAQPHWLASYDSWGNWLNANHTTASGGTLKIQDTYGPRRKSMFRRWLVSMPDDVLGRKDDAPIAPSGLDDANSVVLVGKGSLGTLAQTQPNRVTRAYLSKIGKTGKQAWWVGPENHKARIDMAKQPRTLSTDAWQTAQGDTAEVGVGVLDGMEALDTDATLGDKLITTQTLRPAQVAEDMVKNHFFDVTAHSQGVLASVRTGHLKKDLSLLLEKVALTCPPRTSSPRIPTSVNLRSGRLARNSRPRIPCFPIGTSPHGPTCAIITACIATRAMPPRRSKGYLECSTGKGANHPPTSRLRPRLR